MVNWFCCFWVCSEVAHHGGSVWRRKLLAFWEMGSGKEREESSYKGQHLQWPETSHRPHLLNVPPSFSSTKLRTKPLGNTYDLT
jgi:hypothetical protein